jgi:hypothetical protein
LPLSLFVSDSNLEKAKSLPLVGFFRYKMLNSVIYGFSILNVIEFIGILGLIELIIIFMIMNRIEPK